MKNLFVICFLLFSFNTFSQINIYKHHWEASATRFVDEPFFTTGIDYYRNFKIKEKSYFSYLFSGGVIYTFSGRQDNGEPFFIILPYGQTGVDFNISQDGSNFLNMGMSIFYIAPEFHIGLRHINPKNSNTFRLFVSNVYDYRDFYLRFGVGLSVFIGRKRKGR